MSSHAPIQPTIVGPCMHGEVECTPARHANCRHCGLPIIVVQSWGTQQWLHKGSPSGGSSFLSCPTTSAAPPDMVSGVVKRDFCDFHDGFNATATCICPKPDLSHLFAAPAPEAGGE